MRYNKMEIQYMKDRVNHLKKLIKFKQSKPIYDNSINIFKEEIVCLKNRLKEME